MLFVCGGFGYFDLHLCVLIWCLFVCLVCLLFWLCCGLFAVVGSCGLAVLFCFGCLFVSLYG